MRRRKRLATYMSIALISAGVACGVLAFRLQDPPPPPPLTKLKAPNLTEASKLPPSAPSKQAVNNYVVAPTLPKYISIPAINLPNTEVISLGLDKTGAINVPSSSYVTGWYDGSSKPGQQGAMFIYGHVAGYYTGGIFYNLKELQAGNTITITRGDNKTYTYQVVTRKIYPYQSVDMQAVLSPIVKGVPGLNLMTCTGVIVKGSNPITFNERLVVFTKLVSST
jgi:sortase (surface protein transpeptidase)